MKQQLWEVSKVWCPNVGPDFPRQASSDVSFQTPVENRTELVSNLVRAADNGRDGYVSTYSFPRGHTDNCENIPEINTIFVDFDIPKDSEYRGRNQTLDAWKRSVSKLLIRVNAVATSIIESGKHPYWRASLSGHKGVHLFLDFPTIHHEEGTYTQFKNGLKEFGNVVIENLDESAGGINIEPWVDVDSSDLARLTRMPNTPNHGANHTDDVPWCVPVTIKELTDLDADDYLELTSEPRDVPSSVQRYPSKWAAKTLRQKIRDASGASTTSTPGGGAPNAALLSGYQEDANQDINVSDIPILVGNKPCIMEFVKRNDSFGFGEQSRTMEISVMKELIHKQVPIDVMVDFFRPIDGFDETKTRNTIEDIIQRDYGKLTCKTIWRDAPEFCIAKQGDGDCDTYEDEFGVKQEPPRHLSQ